jgi:hypothetical protein
MRVVVHLGYPRTGSTYLQKNIFPIHRQVCFLGPKNFLNPNDIKITQTNLNLLAKKYNKNLKRIMSKFDKNLIKHFNEKKINIISSENYTNYTNTINNFKDLKYLECLLNQNFENVKIDFLIVLRDQFDLIKSFYYQTYENISKFLNLYEFKSIFDVLDSDILYHKTANFPLRLFLKFYNFNYLNNKLLVNFKNSNIKYLFFEDFKFNKNLFIDELSNFCNFERDYTRKLFNSELINNRKVNGNKNYHVKPYVYKFIHSKLHQFIINKAPETIKLLKSLSKKYLS